MRGFLAAILGLGVLVSASYDARGATPHVVEQRLQVPIDDASGQHWQMQGRICRPADVDAPKLVIINHGSPPKASDRPGMTLAGCDSEVVSWFTARHYAVVLVLRLGYGATGGPWTESYAGCNDADYYKAGLETARQIGVIVDYAVTLPHVDPNGVIVVGQSAGGWGTIAYNSVPHPHVAALINMAGGRGGHYHDQPDSNCKSEQLVDATAKFAKTSPTPMLWIYAGNDSYFNPHLVDDMAKAFVGAGGKLQAYRPDSYGTDGHKLFFGRDGSRIWGPLVDAYLAANSGPK
ncbi:hypothetical protein [Dyella sp. RRB7]|uniref:dienelactone hydrolase family protein n=1 Tax=Dyella sp. RRB7 TaxID=2919502 RepID=UPI001FA9863F|nr:hypothetical protein [Dyella sp. RRB7]